MSGPDLRRITEEVGRRPESWASFREVVREAFDQSAERYEERLAADHLVPLRAALQRVPPPRRALDIGCGTGVAADLLVEKFPFGWICGVDLSFRMIQVAQAKRRSRAARLLVGDAASLPFADASFDLLVLVAVPVFAREIARVLTRGGVLAATFPLGEATPIYLPTTELERLFRAAHLTDTEYGSAGRGTFAIARKPR